MVPTAAAGATRAPVGLPRVGCGVARLHTAASTHTQRPEHDNTRWPQLCRDVATPGLSGPLSPACRHWRRRLTPGNPAGLQALGAAEVPRRRPCSVGVHMNHTTAHDACRGGPRGRNPVRARHAYASPKPTTCAPCAVTLRGTGRTPREQRGTPPLSTEEPCRSLAEAGHMGGGGYADGNLIASRVPNLAQPRWRPGPCDTAPAPIPSRKLGSGGGRPVATWAPWLASLAMLASGWHGDHALVSPPGWCKAPGRGDGKSVATWLPVLAILATPGSQPAWQPRPCDAAP